MIPDRLSKSERDINQITSAPLRDAALRKEPMSVQKTTAARQDSRPGLLQLIRSDIRAKAEWVYGSVSGKTLLKALLTDGTFAMIVYRLMQASQRCHLTPLAMLFNKANNVFGRCIIGRRAEFGPGFVLIHSDGVVINSSVRGGRNVKLEHAVTIGADRNESPVLGDDVFVGAGAKIIGGIRVGSRVKIGANAVVVNDVPEGSTAVGVPARCV
jgi:serine O-acetyltransferase